uniref:GNAT family N-acetyltransferase n=1 Tax=Trichocoleus desertorum TaxID=1481672 RepID=UPI0025B46E28|nr:GNAT family N-acetyltransferase [Trichocoleus desertorum]
MDIQIRLARPEDLDRVIELQTQALEILSSTNYNAQQIQALVTGQAAWRGRDEVIFLAESAGELVGFSGLSTQRQQITAVYTHPQFARQGIGTQVLQALEAAAIEKGYRSLWVTSSLTAVDFYQARGYKLLRKTSFRAETGEWIDCFMLEKWLLSTARTEKHSTYVPLVLLMGLLAVGLILALLR